MRLSSCPTGRRLAFALLCLVGFGGCNALLGTESGIPRSNEADGGAESSGNEQHSGGTPSGTKDGSSSAPPRDDSKPPCDPCQVSLVVKTRGPATNITVHGDYVYFSEYGGVYRVNRKNIPCTTDACKELVADNDTNNDDGSIVASDKLVCWSTRMKFGCATPDLSGRKEVDAAPLDLIGSRMRFDGDSIYVVRGDRKYSTPQSLATANVSALVAGTAALVDISAPSSGTSAFTVGAGHLAWSEETPDTTIRVKELGKAGTIAIPLPSDYSKTNDLTSDLAFYDGQLYIAPRLGRHLYRAPADGSAEAAPFMDVDGARFVIVNAGGVYAAHGGQSNYTDGIVWSPLDPKAPGAPAKQTLYTPNGQVSSFDVGDDGVYFGDYQVVGGDSAVRVLKFE